MNKSKCICRFLFRQLILLLGGAIVGLAALLAAFCVPTGPMRSHVYQSLPMLEREFTSSVLIENYPASMTGSFTDCLMLGNAVYTDGEHSLLERVLYVYRNERYEGDGWAPGYSLKDYLTGNPGYEVEYARYWHGYLVFLKPLLWLTNFNTIRMLAAAVQFMLAGLLVMHYSKRTEYFLSGALLVSLPFLYFFGLYSSLSLSICFYVLMAALLVQERWHETFLSKGGYLEFFLLVGMATAYFDFLTYPLVTLGYPLCVAIYLGHDSWKKNMLHMISYSLEWTVGYLGMWACKWILTDILAGGNVIADAIDTIRFRTAAAGDLSPLSGFASVLQKNLSVYQNWTFALLLLAVGFVLCYKIWKGKNIVLEGRTWAQSLTVAFVALLPFGWTFVVQNHSDEHWMYTCKMFSVSIFAVVCAIGKLIRTRQVEV